MAIILCLGNVGSGKTVTVVKEMVDNQQHLKYYTNIRPTKPRLTPYIVKINSDMIVKKTLKKVVKRRDSGKSEAVYDFTLNKEFWQAINEPISVVLDEVHTLMNPRRSGSKINVIVSDFLAMLRRVIGENPMVEGDLYLITQLSRRTDVIAREMVHQVRYHVCHYLKTCDRCGLTWQESSEMPEPQKVCPACTHYRLRKHGHRVEVKHFAGIEAYDAWKEFGIQSWHRRYYVDDVSDYFEFYDTLQWEDMFSTLY